MCFLMYMLLLPFWMCLMDALLLLLPWSRCTGRFTLCAFRLHNAALWPALVLLLEIVLLLLLLPWLCMYSKIDIVSVQSPIERCSADALAAWWRCRPEV
jgi:Mg2+/citrate symporter